MVVWGGELSELSHGATLAGMLFTGPGFSLIFSPLNTDALNRLPDALRGPGSSVTQTFRNFDSAIGMGDHGHRGLRLGRRTTPQPIRACAYPSLSPD